MMSGLLSGGALCGGTSRSPSPATSDKSKKSTEKNRVLAAGNTKNAYLDGLLEVAGYPDQIKEQSENFLRAQGIATTGMLKLLTPEDVDAIPSTELSLGCKALIRDVFSKSGGIYQNTHMKESKLVEKDKGIDIDNLTFDQGMELLEKGEVQIDASGEEENPFCLEEAPSMLPPKAALSLTRKALQKRQRLNEEEFPSNPISSIYNPDWRTTPNKEKGVCVWPNFATYLAAWNMSGYVWTTKWKDGLGPLIAMSTFQMLTNSLLYVCSSDGPNVAVVFVDQLRGKIAHNLAHKIKGFNINQYINDIDWSAVRSIKDKISDGTMVSPIRKYVPNNTNPSYSKDNYFSKGKGKGKVQSNFPSSNYSNWNPDLNNMCRSVGACSFYASKGYCQYGESCYWKHLTAEQLEKGIVDLSGQPKATKAKKKKSRSRSRRRSRSRDRRSRRR